VYPEKASEGWFVTVEDIARVAPPAWPGPISVTTVDWKPIPSIELDTPTAVISGLVGFAFPTCWLGHLVRALSTGGATARSIWSMIRKGIRRPAAWSTAPTRWMSSSGQVYSQVPVTPA
jgi:hypothetical protein